MTTSASLSGRNDALTSRPTYTRRPISSNIGIRRQHLSSQLAGPLAQANLSPSNAGGHRRSDKQIEPSNSRRRGRLPNFPPSSRPRYAHSDRSSTAGNHPDTTGGRIRTTARSDLSQPTSLSNQTDVGDTASSDEESLPAVPNNPDLDLLPVVKTHHARTSFDFYVNSYVTSIIEVSPQDIGKYPHVVHQILHDELLFTAFTTCSEAARWRTQSLYDDPPLSVARGYGKTISLLSQRLQSAKFAMSPAVLLSMGQLVAIETLIRNVSATARHLAGMQSAMRPKGASVPPQASSPVAAAVDIWTQYFAHRSVVKSSVSRLDTLTYPRHPFDEDLSVQISQLPIGFANVALAGSLSVELLALIGKFNVYFETINQMIKEGIADSPDRTEIILRQAAYCIEYTQIQTLTLIERLILAALTAYVVRRDRVHPALINIRNYYQITCAYTTNLLSSNSLQLQDQGSSLVTWIGLMLLLTSTPEAYARKLALKLLPRRPEPSKILKQCQDFFWDDDLTAALFSGNVLVTPLSNDIVADNMKQALPGGDD